jgi:hypothetical protein
VRPRIALLALLVAAPAAAQPATTPASAPSRVALAPLASLGEGAAQLGPVEQTIGEGLAGVPGTEVVAAADVAKAAKKAKRSDLGACEGQPPCLVEVGKLVGAAIVVTGDVSELGEVTVVYLKAVDAAGNEISSTTAVLSHDDAGRRAEARAAAFRLLAPASYLGSLRFEVNVPGAVAYLDGAKVNPGEAIRTTVGTHAVRVTHEQHRDFVRFVEVKFDEETVLPVALTPLPVVVDEMRQKEAARRRMAVTEPLPWYRRWYTVAGAGAALAAVTFVVVYLVVDKLDFDSELPVH